MAATASAAGTTYRAVSDRGRPLSTVQLISQDKTGQDGEEEADDEKRNKKRSSENFVGKFSVHHNDSGIENEGFDLGSPLAVDNRQSKISYRDFKLCGDNCRNRSPVDNNQEQKRQDTIIRESLQISNGNVQRSEELRRSLTVSMENCDFGTAEQRNRKSGAHTDAPGTLKRHMETPVRSSWLLDGNVRRRDDAVWRRRKTDPSGDVCTSSNYSYHRDYQEALSSLLWEPYDCRQPEDSAPQHSAFGSGCAVDEGDVSVWLYPRVMRTAHLSSSSSSTLSISSYSSSAVVSAMGTSGDGHLWNRDARDPSSSSLRALILSNSSSKDEDLTTSLPCSNNALKLSELRSEPVDVSSSCGSNTIGNVTADPNQHEDEEGSRREDAVADLHTRWAVAGPPGALQSPDRCELCWQASSQCESSAATMLVNVAGADGAPSVSASGSGAVTSSSSVSVVSCYRAVPVVVSAVPTISCLNVSHVNVEAGVSAARGRTFTSTEAQTDDIGVAPATPLNNNREQRRRERRERRHQRRANNSNPPQHETHWQTLVTEPPPAAGGGERLPDILNSHLPPPYSTLPLGLPPPGHVVHHPPPPPPVPVPVPVTTAAPGSPPPPPHHHHHGGMRFPFQITPGERRRSRRSPRGQHYTPEEEPKSCCGVVVTQAVSIRWFIVVIAVVGICCAVVGTVLGAMKASGREHLTVSLLLIGVGIVLITVSGVAWRLTAHDAPSCRMMLGLGGGDEGGAEPNRRFVPRLPPSYGRPHHPYAAMMYPEFQYRPPPPSYQASMQEYRLRLLLLDRHPGSVAPGQAPGGHAVSPPPTYRSHAGSTLRAPLGVRRDQPQSDYSRPPSYRSRTSSTRPTLDPNGNTGCTTAEHSRDPSLSLSDSGGGSGVVNVISVMGSGELEPEHLDTIKLAGLPADHDVPLRMMLNKGNCHSNMDSDGKDGNLVTIVQTGNDSSPVIVTVSGSTVGGSTSQQPATGIVDTEMEILAHL